MPRRYVLGWLALLLMVAVLVRVDGVNDYYYNPDETLHTAMAEGATLGDVWNYSKFEVHPPLGNFLRHYWMMISSNVAFVRGESLLFGIGLILVFYRIGLVIGGPFTGLVYATLATFSQACIVQSYITRNYTFFLFFLACALFFYLRWREKHGTVSLLWYTFFGLLACLTHFTAGISVACIAASEALVLLAERRMRLLTPWAAINAGLILVTIALYYLWQPVITLQAKTYVDPLKAGVSWIDLIVPTLKYDYSLCGYLFWNRLSAVVLILGILAYFPVICRDRKGTPCAIFLLCALSVTASFLLSLTGLYPLSVVRHNLWLLVSILPAAGWVTTEALAWGGRRWVNQAPQRWMPIMAATLFAAGCLSYHYFNRFSDYYEYPIPRKDWSEVTARLNALGPGDIIVVEKDDGMLLANLYPYLSLDATDPHLVTLAPYRGTHLLFNRYYPRLSREHFLTTLESAAHDDLFKGTGRVVFLSTPWSNMPLSDLMLCDALEKQVTLIAAPTQPRPLTRAVLDGTRLALLTVPTKALMADLVAQGGKARACIKDTNNAPPRSN